jgi:hypothetical protein
MTDLEYYTHELEQQEFLDPDTATTTTTPTTTTKAPTTSKASTATKVPRP